MNWLRVHRDVLAENRRLYGMVVNYAQENDRQRAELRSAADMCGHYKRQVQDRDALIAGLETRIVKLASDFDSLMGVTEGGAG